MTDTTFDPDTAAKPARAGVRARLRQERQARVGILRNPNHPPVPPLRRAPLMGKWPNLRSSRRPAPVDPAAPELTPNPPPVAVEDALHRAADGTVARIDVHTLMASVDGLGTAKPARAAFASEYRHDLDAPAQAPVARPHPSILSAEAWRDDEMDEPVADPGLEPHPPPHPGRHPRLRRVAGMLASACLVGLLGLLALGMGP